MVECMHPHGTSDCTPRSNDVTSNIQAKLDLGLHVVLSPGMKMRAVLCLSSVCQTVSVETCIIFRLFIPCKLPLLFFAKEERHLKTSVFVTSNCSSDLDVSQKMAHTYADSLRNGTGIYNLTAPLTLSTSGQARCPLGDGGSGEVNSANQLAWLKLKTLQWIR